MITEEQAIQFENELEELELHDMNEEAITKVIDGLSKEAHTLRRHRKGVRFLLYKIQNNKNGTGEFPSDKLFSDRVDMSPEEFVEHFESQEGFSGWKMFGENWDVSLTDPYSVVHRDKSTAQEWQELITAKFPTIKPGGEIVYPDINVRNAVEKEAKIQAELKK